MEKPKRNERYGDAVNDPMKFCKLSMSPGKGSRNRTSSYEKFRKNYEQINWKQ